MVRKSGSRFSSELSKIASRFEKSLKNKTAAEIRADARKIYTTKQFEIFKAKYTKEEFLVAYASKVVDVIDRNVKRNDIECKKDLLSRIISEPGIGLNKAFESFNPDKLKCTVCGLDVINETNDTVSNWFEKDGEKLHIEDGGVFAATKLICRICTKSSAQILNDGDFYEKDGKKFHKEDDGEIVCKSFNSWIIDHIQYPTKNIDKDTDKRSQYKEYACPECGKFVLESTRGIDEILICKACSEETETIVSFAKDEALRSKKSFYNTEMSRLSQPIGNSEDENLTLNNILYDKEDDSEEFVLRSRLSETIKKIKKVIEQEWPQQKTGIFKDPKEEAKMFDYFIPSEFLYSDMELKEMTDETFDLKVKRPAKATGLIIAEKAGNSFPYAICLDCGLKINLGKNWEVKSKELKKYGCPHSSFAIEHKPSWNDSGLYDQSQAITEPTFQYRIGFEQERGLSAGSNNGEEVDFDSKGKVPISITVENYDEKRQTGLNLQLRSHKNGFSDVGKGIDIPLPTGYMGEKERITQYMHQVANRWMGKLRQDCPKCHFGLERLEQMTIGQGKMTCKSCGHTWDLREGDFLKRIKKNGKTKELWKLFLSVLHEILILRKQNNTNVISLGKVSV